MTAPDATDRTLPPIEVRNLDHAKHFRIYRNGDPYYAGHPFRWNKRHFRTFDSFLGAITDCVKLQNGAVRRIYTPNHGTRIKDISELEEGGFYVAASQERFKKLKYTEIEKSPRRKPPRNLLDIPQKNKRYQDVTGKIPQMKTQGLKIHVWKNREEIHPPDPITLAPNHMERMDSVIKQVDEKLRRKCTRCVARLYNQNGSPIRDPAQLRQDECYVAVEVQDHFQHCRYRERGLNNFMTSPHITKYPKLPPLNISRGSKNGKQWSPDQSGPSSYPNSENSYRQQYHRKNRQSREQREVDEVFPRKPVPYKRSSERKQQRELDLDKDEGGVFKSKQSNRYTQGAREVNENRDTRVDLPIDQVQAEEVKEEEQGMYESSDDKTAPVPSGVELTKLPSEQNSEDTKDEDEEEQIHRKPNRDNNTNNNRTPPKNKSKAKEGNRGKKSTTQGEKNGYNRTPNGLNVSPGREEENNRRNSDRQAYGGMNGYDDRNNSPPRYSESPRQSPTQRRSPTPRSPTPQRESPRSWRRNSTRRDSGRRSSRLHSPQQNVDHNWQEEDAAAQKIQAHYRGYQVRRDMKKNDHHDDHNDHNDQGLDDFLQREREEAATKIQSHYRGYSERKRYAERKAARVMSAGRKSARSERPQSHQDEDFRDPGHRDSDLENAAATTIQAGYRGYRDRRRLNEGR